MINFTSVAGYFWLIEKRKTTKPVISKVLNNIFYIICKMKRQTYFNQ